MCSSTLTNYYTNTIIITIKFHNLSTGERII
nr:MAG TPA: hypothetical protein [Crassvirales sp.]